MPSSSNTADTASTASNATTATSAVRLRPAQPTDIPRILGLIRELAEYEREPESAVATPEHLFDHLFGPQAVAHAIMAEDDTETFGFALYFFNFSTWTGRRGLYLEDFYVRPSARSHGIGRQIFTRLANIAVECDCSRLELSVLNWNTNAIRFYEHHGGVAMRDWTHYRFDVDAISRIAAQGITPEPK